MKRVAVVILNWNGQGFLEKFLPSVVLYSREIADVVVIDNDSTDDSVSFLTKHYPAIRVIQNAENGGFSKGYNDGLKLIEAQYYVLLNSDVEVSEGWLEPLVNMLDMHMDVAACQPKIRSWDERNRFEYAGAAGGFIDEFGYPFCRGRIFDVTEVDAGQYDDCCEIFWATGACLVVRAELYHVFGGLDEHFFAHMEEIDFCWRLKNAGYKLMFCPESTVFHVGGGTLPTSSPQKTYLNFRNNLFLLIKNLPEHRLLWVLFIRWILDSMAMLQFLIKKEPGNARAVIKAQWHIVCAFNMYLKKRKLISQCVVGQMYKRSLVFEYFVRGIHQFSGLSSKKWS